MDPRGPLPCMGGAARKGKVMSTVINEILLENEPKMVEGVVFQLRRSGADHYRKMDEAVLQNRAQSLVKTFIRSARETPGEFIDYIQSITEDRISEGIPLQEIQIALQILEQKAWQLIVGHVPDADQVRCLSLISRIIGAAKDNLAQVYLRHLEKAESRAEILQSRLDQLAKGTDSGPLSEDDLPGRI